MKVTMYKAQDGSIHAKKADMEAHNLTLRLKPAADKFVAALDYSQFYKDDRGNNVIYPEDDLADFIVRNADGLRRLLNDVLVVRRPRKKATAKESAVSVAQA